eukprot:4402866-Prymnesium_polylepis.1
MGRSNLVDLTAPNARPMVWAIETGHRQLYRRQMPFQAALTVLGIASDLIAAQREACTRGELGPRRRLELLVELLRVAGHMQIEPLQRAALCERLNQRTASHTTQRVIAGIENRERTAGAQEMSKHQRLGFPEASTATVQLSHCAATQLLQPQSR